MSSPNLLCVDDVPGTAATVHLHHAVVTAHVFLLMAHVAHFGVAQPVTTDPLSDALEHLEDACIHTRDDARTWVRFGSMMRRVIASEPSKEWPDLRELDAAEQQAVELVNKWRRAPPPLKARLIKARDLWLLRLRLEWDVEDTGYDGQ